MDGFREPLGLKRFGSVSACLQISLDADRRLLLPDTIGYKPFDPIWFLTRHESPPFKRAAGTDFVQNHPGRIKAKHDLRQNKVNIGAFQVTFLRPHENCPKIQG
ncbi:hypothetical protein HY2_15840 [Hyphomonas pacifica]|nr:hypothetical protein HY2_15840 [Hyphomonas pacifica]